jgi:hypothetical protein
MQNSAKCSEALNFEATAPKQPAFANRCAAAPRRRGRANKFQKLIVQKSVVRIELPPRFGEYVQPVSECVTSHLECEVERLV